MDILVEWECPNRTLLTVGNGNGNFQGAELSPKPLTHVVTLNF